MKKMLLWDPRFPDRAPARLTLADDIASAIVRSGVGTPANQGDYVALAAGAALDPGSLVEVVLLHGAANSNTRRVVLPLSVAMVAAAFGSAAGVSMPIGGGTPAPTPTPTPTPTPDVWRTASANMIGQAAADGNNLATEYHAFRQGYYIGSGDRKELRFSHFNWYSSSGAQSMFATDMVFPAMYLIINGISVRLTQGGGTTITVPAGANRFTHDTVLPAQFGLTQFARGALAKLRGVVHRNGAVVNMPVSQTVQTNNDTTNNEAMWFDAALGLPTNIGATDGAFAMPTYTPASITLSGTVATVTVGAGNPLPSMSGKVTIAGATPSGYNGPKAVTGVDAGAGTFTFTATAGLASPATGAITYSATKSAGAAGYRPVLEGKFVTGDPPTMFIGGDSIDTGLVQTANAASGPFGIGRNVHALHDVGALTNFTAYMSCAVGGSTVDQFTGDNDLTWTWMTLCNGAIGAHLTNSFGIPGTGKTGAEMLGLMRLWWAKLGEMGVKNIVALGGQTRGTTTDSFQTEEGQTINPGWLAGANVEQYHALLPGEVSAGRIKGFVNFQSWRGVDPNKWKVNGTSTYACDAGGTHPSSVIHFAEAAEIRPVLATLGMLA